MDGQTILDKSPLVLIRIRAGGTFRGGNYYEPTLMWASDALADYAVADGQADYVNGEHQEIEEW